MADVAAVPGSGALAQEQQQTSLRYLRLRSDFRSMLKTGMDCLDSQAFAQMFSDALPPHLLQHVWVLLRKQCDAIVEVASDEMEAACGEVGLLQQLQELEALVLQRGLLGTDSGPADPRALPAAAEASARLATKQGEKQQLEAALQQLLQQQAALQAELEAKQGVAGELVADVAAAEDQVDKVYKASMSWMAPAASDAPCAGRGKD